MLLSPKILEIVTNRNFIRNQKNNFLILMGFLYLRKDKLLDQTKDNNSDKNVGSQQSHKIQIIHAIVLKEQKNRYIMRQAMMNY